MRKTGAKTHLLPRPCENTDRCHGLAPWRVTFVATKRVGVDFGCHGLAPWRFTLAAPATANFWTKSSKREIPRGKPVASRQIQWPSDSSEPESPRHKAVASVCVFN